MIQVKKCLEEQLRVEIERKSDLQTLCDEEKRKIAEIERNANELKEKFKHELATKEELCQS